MLCRNHGCRTPLCSCLKQKKVGAGLHVLRGVIIFFSSSSQALKPLLHNLSNNSQDLSVEAECAFPNNSRTAAKNFFVDPSVDLTTNIVDVVLLQTAVPSMRSSKKYTSNMKCPSTWYTRWLNHLMLNLRHPHYVHGGKGRRYRQLCGQGASRHVRCPCKQRGASALSHTDILDPAIGKKRKNHRGVG